MKRGYENSTLGAEIQKPGHSSLLPGPDDKEYV